jgi:hypothetical protein
MPYIIVHGFMSSASRKKKRAHVAAIARHQLLRRPFPPRAGSRENSAIGDLALGADPPYTTPVPD